MMKVSVHFADGFEEIEALAVVDVLRRAQIKTIMVSMTRSLEVKGSHAIRVICDRFFSDLDYSDVQLMVLPGGMPGAAHLNEHEGLDELIREFILGKKSIAAICAAPMILGSKGYLDQKMAVCYPGFEKFISNSISTENSLVKDGNIITAKGAGIAIDFGLAIVEHLKGKGLADELATQMIHTRIHKPN
jgi:protein deglycase